MPNAIAVDFDGVIHKYSKGWQDGSIYDPPMEGVKEALSNLISEGYEIVIFSTRCYSRKIKGVEQKSQAKEVEEYLKKYKIPYTNIHTEGCKPFCKAFIDDRAIRFENWSDAFIEVKELIKTKGI